MSNGAVASARGYLAGPSGLGAWFSSRDHKRVGMMYLGWTMGVLLLGLLFQLLMVIRSVGGMGEDPAIIFRAITYDRLLLVFLFLAPVIPVTLGYFLLPLQIGARNMALPGLSIWSLRFYAAGLVFLLASYVFGAVACGWTLATPLSLTAPGSFTPLFLGLALVGLSWLQTGVNIILTVNTGRDEDMGFFDMPLMTWGVYLGGYLLAAMGILLAVIVLYLAAGRAVGHGPFGPGSDPLAWLGYFWFVTRPAAYFAVIPAVGVIFSVVEGISRKRTPGYRWVVGAMITLLAVGVSTWGIHLGPWGQAPQTTFVFSVLSVLVVIPAAVLGYFLLATLYRGAVACAAPTTFTVAFLLHAGIAVSISLFLASPAPGAYLGATMFATAQLNYILWGCVLAALLAGLNFWWPKMTGHTLNQAVGRFGGFLYLLGVNLMFIPQLILGARGVPADMGPFAEGATGLGETSGLGMLFLFFGLMTVVSNFIGSLVCDKPVADNPWGAEGREWLVSSPPPAGNFD